MNLIFRLIDYGSSLWEEAVILRERILREPLGQKFTEAELEEESKYFHVGGFIRNELVSAAVLVPENDGLKMQRVVVKEKFRNKEVGSEMMVFCEDFAKARKFRTIYCHARDSAVKFYLKNGYSKEGDYFSEDGIPHLRMVKALM